MKVTDDRNVPADDVGHKSDPNDAHDEGEGIPSAHRRSPAIGDCHQEHRVDRPRENPPASLPFVIRPTCHIYNFHWKGENVMFYSGGLGFFFEVLKSLRVIILTKFIANF